MGRGVHVGAKAPKGLVTRGIRVTRQLRGSRLSVLDSFNNLATIDRLPRPTSKLFVKVLLKRNFQELFSNISILD